MHCLLLTGCNFILWLELQIMVKILNAWELGSWLLQPVPPWVHVGQLLGRFQPLLSLLVLVQLTAILTALFSSLIPFSSLSLSF